jgi:hypothetical protein
MQTDNQLRAAVLPVFDLTSFRRVALEGDPDFHFQSVILRRTPRSRRS